MLTARQVLIADVSRLQQKLEKDISAKLTGDKKPADRTPLENHKAGILKEIITKAKSITNKYAISLMPEDETTLQTNTVYVEWDGHELKYIFLNALGESGAVKRHEGVITKDKLPELAAVAVPLEKAAIQPLCIDILTILSAKDQLKFNLSDLGNKNRNQVLREVLQERDNEFNAWLHWMDSNGLAPVDQYKVQKLYFRKEFEKLEKQKEDESSEDFEIRAEKHFANELKETAKFENLYRVVFQFYYRLARQMFCLQQFAAVKDPEDFIADAEDRHGKLKAIFQNASGCNIQSLQEEHAIFEAAFKNLIKHITEESDVRAFADVPATYRALGKLVALFDYQIKKLQQAKTQFADIRNKAQAAAKSGDKSAFLQHKKDAKAQIIAINSVQQDLVSQIQQYTASLQDQIHNIEQTKGLIEASLAPIIPQIPDMVYLMQIAIFIEFHNEERSEFARLDQHVKELSDACKEHNGLVKENGWGALASSVAAETKTMLAKLQDYAKIYLDQDGSVEGAAINFAKIVMWQKNIASFCKDVPAALKEVSKKLDTMPAEVEARWRKPYEELLRHTKLNGFIAFLRRHWWKMILAGALLAAVTAPLAFFALGSFALAAIIGSVVFVVGVAIGAGICKASDMCHKGKKDDDAGGLRRGSSADVVAATKGSAADRAAIAQQEGRPQQSGGLPAREIVIDFDQLDAKLDSASGTESTSTQSYNPFA